MFLDAYPHQYASAQRAIDFVGRRLPRLGFGCEYVLPREGPFADELRAAGQRVTVLQVPPALDRYGETTTGLALLRGLLALPAYWLRLRRHLRGRVGVVHVCSQRSVILAAPAARLARVPVVWQVSIIERHPWVSTLCDLLASRTVVLSEAVRVRSLRPWRHQAVVPMPLDERFDDPPRARPHPPPVVVTASRLEPMKNLHVLLEAFALVRRALPDARLRIIGGDQEGHEGYRVSLEKAAARLGIAEAVTFTGYAARPEERWSDASVYVNTSVLEGLGLAIAEAMACGLPAVFPSVIGLAEFVDDGRDALLVPPDDPEATAAAVVRVLTDPALAQRLAAAGPEVARRFSLDRIAPETAAVYDELLAR
jgi:glycosyltransferase involved in cell wall biosynthesis